MATAETKSQFLTDAHELRDRKFAEVLASLDPKAAAAILLNPTFKSLFDCGFAYGLLVAPGVYKQEPEAAK
jgi:hypothetical protein